MFESIQDYMDKLIDLDELIERMKPGGSKLELFARPHNRRQGWISLGNQLPGVYFVEEEIIERFNKAYPNDKLDKGTMEQNKIKSTTVKEINNKDSNENEENQLQDNEQDLQEPEPEQIGDDYCEENEF